MKEFSLFDHDFKGKGMKFCYHDPNSLPFLIQGILSLVDGISPTHFAPGGGGGGYPGCCWIFELFGALDFLAFNATRSRLLVRLKD